MAEAAPSPAGSPTTSPLLEERERLVLAELARDLDASVSFQGLRRQLGVHQQALVRTLRRLEAQGLVARDARGYALTDAGAQRVADASAAGAAALAGRAPTGAKSFPVLEALLPAEVGPGEVAAHLSRRWFGGLRWYAASEAPGETSLHWIAEPGKGRVTVRIAGGSLSLHVTDPESRELLAAIRPVLAAVAELYGLAGSSGLVQALGEDVVGLAG